GVFGALDDQLIVLHLIPVEWIAAFVSAKLVRTATHRMAGCAIPTNFAGHAPAGPKADPKLTFKSYHLEGADRGGSKSAQDCSGADIGPTRQGMISSTHS